MAVSKLDEVVSLAKRRGFVFPAGEIYGGTRSAWDYGPLGVALHSHRLEDFEKRRNEIRRGGRPRVGAGRRNDEDDDRKSGRSFGGKRGSDRNDHNNKRGGFKGDRNDKRGGFKGDRRGGKNFGGKRGSKPSFDTDFDDED